MAYDAATGTVVLFGGSLDGDFGGTSGTDYNDTWIWDGKTWTQLFPSVSPPARRFDTQGMAYDARTGTVVLFGGITATQTVLGDTWTWNGRTKTWTQQHPANSPSARRAPIAYDGATGTIVLFSGDNGAIAIDAATWVWNGANWLHLSPLTAPAPRAMASMAYDASILKVVEFGGNSIVNFDDTWTWDGTTWTPSPTTGPCGRFAAGLAYDPVAQGEVLFGGAGCFGPQNDTWVFAMAP